MVDAGLSTLKVGTGWLEIEIVSEPDVRLTFSGYAPILQVRVCQSGIEKALFISAKSLSTALENLRVANNGSFVGIRVRLKKESEDRMAPYLVEVLDNP